MEDPAVLQRLQGNDRAGAAELGRGAHPAPHAAGIQSAFQCYNINSFESVERLMRRGVYKGPLVMNWVAISGGMDQANIYNLANFVRAIARWSYADGGKHHAQRACRST